MKQLAVRALITLLIALGMCIPSSAQRRRSGNDFTFTILGGAGVDGEFPPGLNTADPDTDIRVDETPDGYGFESTTNGLLIKGTIPSGTARVSLTSSISSTNYTYHYNRLWLANSNILEYYAPFYSDVIVKQRLSKIPFIEDGAAIVGFVPVGNDEMLVVKTTGAFLVANINDTRALMTRTDLGQEMTATNTSMITALDKAGYVSNAQGLFTLRGGTVIELSRKLRNNIGNFANKALTIDYKKKRIIGGTTFVYDIETEKFWRYSGSSFRYTTRRFTVPGTRPVAIDRLVFRVLHLTKRDAWFKYQTRHNEEDWGRETRVKVPYVSEHFTTHNEDLAEIISAQRFQLRLTDMSANLAIKEIRVDSTSGGFDDYK